MYNESVFSRKFSLSDLIYAASGYRAKDRHQLVSQMVIGGTGHIPDETLQQALNAATLANPAYRTRLAGYWGFKRWRADGPLPTVRTLQFEWDGQFQADLPFIDTPLDLIHGPVAEVIQVIGTTTWLVFRVHHAVTDGVGLKDFVENVFEALNQKPITPYHSTLTLENLPEGNLNAIPTPVRDANVPYDLQTTEGTEPDRSRIWKRVTIPGKDSRILLRTILALGKAAQVTKEDGQVRINVPVNLRRHIPLEQSSANLVGMLRLDLQPNDTLRSLVKQFSLKMEQRQELPIAVKSLTSRAMFWIPLRVLRALERLTINKLFTQPRFPCSGTVSSIGMVDLQEYSAPGFAATTAIGIPVPPLGTPLMLVIISTEQQHELVLSASRALINPAELDRLADMLTQELTREN